ncbi:lysosomal thioesterase PPT2-A-like isoform X2 [Astyanax mexicanus]|uniref:lysosomal thioesterase PPT2-A-like isoform X2 n=1 Tax=Astyanax mexicanus TaxID=7994 RepID=UPI000BBDA575|nr:lysosomal thioesterase PPT2-A-like isoform X2 [Astyanax mexicanus]
MIRNFINFVLSCVLLAVVCGYRPVVIVHGLFDGPKQFVKLGTFISETHPGTNVTTVDLYDNMASLKPLWQQVEGFRKAVLPIMESATDGIHFICFSQETSYLKKVFPKDIKSGVYRLCYNCWGQKISICNFWNDPHQRVKYLKSNTYLALLNGESKTPNITEWRERFLGIKKLVLIGGPDDGVITPWQSSLFGFYDSNETVVEMRKQRWYQMDVFGLKTLDSRGDVVQCVVPGVGHVFWHSNITVYKECIEKWLT